jgi:hypothetical protein
MIVVLALLLIAVAAGLAADIARIWLPERAQLAAPERAQLLTACAVFAFAGAFLVAHATGDTAAENPAPAAPQASAPSGDGALTRLAVSARLPGLRTRPHPDRSGQREKPRHQPAPDEPTTTTTTSTTTTSTSTTTTPTTTPAPPPEPPPLNFDDSG